MRFFIRLVFSLTLISFSQLAISVDYYWTYQAGSSNAGPYTSALQACEANTSPTQLAKKGTSGDQFYCQYLNSYGNWQSTSNRYVFRSGTTCFPDTTYNPGTGECEAPPPDECEAKNGQSLPFTKNGLGTDSYCTFIPGLSACSQSACFSGCAVDTFDQKCTFKTSGKYTCVGSAIFTGQECSTSGQGTEIESDTDNTPRPDPKTENKDEPCNYSTNPDGSQTCTSEKSTEKEGQSCGTINGVKKCYDTNPTKDGIEIETEVKTETKPDGTSTTTKTDTATKTTCSGVNSCTSTTTTTTTTIEKDADGKTNSISGVCTGEACPDKNTNPDGDGDGFGDCVGGDCTGTAGGPLGSPELEEVAGFGETTTGFAERIAASPIIAAIDGIGLNGGGSCTMSSGTTIIGTIDASSFCDNSNWLDPLYYVFLAIHALVAVRVFLSA